MNQNPFYWSSLSQTSSPSPYFINVSPNTLTFSYESGLTDTFQVSGNTGYTITSFVPWLSAIPISGSGVTIITVETLTINSGVTDRIGSIEMETNTSPDVFNIVTVTQTFEPQPPLFIMTEGGQFVGDLV